MKDISNAAPASQGLFVHLSFGKEWQDELCSLGMGKGWDHLNMCFSVGVYRSTRILIGAHVTVSESTLLGALGPLSLSCPSHHD